jgi:hypothetical protein
VRGNEVLEIAEVIFTGVDPSLPTADCGDEILGVVVGGCWDHFVRQAAEVTFTAYSPDGPRVQCTPETALPARGQS